MRRFGKLQPLPRDLRPVDERPSKDAVWTEVARELRTALKRPLSRQTAASGLASMHLALDVPAPGPCFGRDVLISDLEAALLGQAAPRVSILGPAGIGKTTVSLAALHRPAVVERHGSRRYFVHLDAAADAEATAASIASALRIEAGPDLRARALRELARAPAVLVLDNLETPWDQDGSGVEELLAQLTALSSLALVVSVCGADRPEGAAWTRDLRVEPLREADAVDAFCGIAGEYHRAAPELGPLLAKQQGGPLAIQLLAHAARGNDLANLAEEWETRQTALLARGGGSRRDSRAGRHRSSYP